MAISTPPPKTAHLLLIPWPTQGHINPMMLLANHLASHGGLLITFLHSARNFSLLQLAQSKRRKTTPDGQRQQLIRLEVLPDGLPPEEMRRPTDPELVASMPVMEDGLDQLMERLKCEENPVSCIVSDSFLPWTQDVAHRFGIPRIEFWTSSATVYSIACHLPQLVSRGYIPVKGNSFVAEHLSLASHDVVQDSSKFRMMGN